MGPRMNSPSTYCILRLRLDTTPTKEGSILKLVGSHLSIAIPTYSLSIYCLDKIPYGVLKIPDVCSSQIRLLFETIQRPGHPPRSASSPAATSPCRGHQRSDPDSARSSHRWSIRSRPKQPTMLHA